MITTGPILHYRAAQLAASSYFTSPADTYDLSSCYALVFFLVETRGLGFGVPFRF